MWNRINLIYYKYYLCRLILEALGYVGISSADEFVRLDEPENQVYTLHRGGGYFLHIDTELVLCLVNARSIEEDYLSPVIRKHCLYSVSCGLRLIRGNRDLLSDNAVHQCGFTDIRSSDKRYKAALCFSQINSPSCQIVCCFRLSSLQSLQL